MFKVRLINRVASHGRQLFPVCGASTKEYGQSVFRPEFDGFVFEMSLEDYDRDKFDIVGQDKFQQQWVPEFIAGEGEIMATVSGVEIPPETTSEVQPVKPLMEPSLTQRAKDAGVYKRGMNEEQMKVALGFPD